MSASAFLTEVPKSFAELEPSPSQTNIFSVKFETEESRLKRLFITLWYKVTQNEKVSRMEKEHELRELTRRTNSKVKTEVRGIMNLVTFDAWKGWASRKVYRREQAARAKEVVDAAKALAVRRGEAERRRRSRDDNGSCHQRTHSAGSADRPSTPSTLPSSSSSSPSHHSSLSPRPPPPSSPCRKPNSPRNKPSSSPAAAAAPRKPSSPLSTAQESVVRRLSSPQNYIPSYLRRNASDSPPSRPGTFVLISSDLDYESSSAGGPSEAGEFERTLARMYAAHRRKLREARERKGAALARRREEEANGGRGRGGGERVSGEERRRRAARAGEQRRVTDRLFSGLGPEREHRGDPATDGEGGGPGGGGPGLGGGQRGAGRKLKKYVVVEEMRRESKVLMEFMERLTQTPVGGAGEEEGEEEGEEGDEN